MTNAQRQKLVEDAVACARIAWASIEGEQDGGTCNFDSALVHVERDEKLEAMMKEAGLRAFYWTHGLEGPGYKFFSTRYQGCPNTTAQERFAEEMKKRGYETCVYYKMD